MISTEDGDTTRASVRAVGGVWLLAVCILTGAVAGAQNEPSLGDVARRSRKERSQTKEETPAASTAKELAAELEQEQEEAATAPDGFQWFNGQGYSVSVPAPFSVEGRDDAGVLLATADVTGITTKVFAANPIAVPSRPDELKFHELARQWWQPYGSLACAKATPGVAGHTCTIGGNLLGNQFFGQARFVEGDRRIVPVICFATSLVNNNLDYSIRRRTKEELDNLRDETQSNVGRRDMAQASKQLCNAVLDSIRLKEEDAHPRPVRRAQAEKASLATYREVAAGGAALGDVARQSRKEAAQQEKPRVSVEAEDTINAPPPGFRVYSNTRCVRECWQESFFLPEGARHVKGGNSENVYVVTSGTETSIIVYFGETDVVAGYSNYGTAQDVARKWIHAELDWRTKPVQLTGTVNGHAVQRTRSRLTANLNGWIEEDVVVEGDGINFNIGCIAREDRFADAESTCSTVWESWRIHR